LWIFSVISINIFFFVIFPELLFSSLALISAINNLVASSFQNTGWAEVDGADSESGYNTGRFDSSFLDPCFTFSMDKQKIRIKQVLQLKIVINNDSFITQGHSAYLGSATKIILLYFVLIWF
jgi:hypothetical protein